MLTQTSVTAIQALLYIVHRGNGTPVAPGQIAQQLASSPSYLAKINTDLVRVRYTKRQWHLSQYKRKRNVKDAFAVRDGHDFSSRKICLVDDITTSGATLNECARTLKDAGAEFERITLPEPVISVSPCDVYTEKPGMLNRTPNLLVWNVKYDLVVYRSYKTSPFDDGYRV